MEQNETRADIYFIPHNFVDTGTLFNGMVRIRNFFEGLLLAALPIPIIIQIQNLSFTNRITLFVTFCGAFGLAGFVGIDGESLTQFLFNYIRFRRNRKTARYNPRVKLEAVPEYLENKDGNLPRDRILKMINSIRNRSLGESDEFGGISSELFDKSTQFFFEDDVGILDKPDALKTRAEQKAEKKKRPKVPKARAHKTSKRKKQKKPQATTVTTNAPIPAPLEVDLSISTHAVTTTATECNPQMPVDAAPRYSIMEVALDIPTEVLPLPDVKSTAHQVEATPEASFVTIHGLSKNIITVSNTVTRGDRYSVQKEGESQGWQNRHQAQPSQTRA